MNRFLTCTVAIVIQLVCLNVASAKTFPDIVATLDLSKRDAGATDAFYSALTKAGREPFYLSLTLNAQPDLRRSRLHAEHGHFFSERFIRGRRKQACLWRRRMGNN